jgi:hypothetical protein
MKEDIIAMARKAGFVIDEKAQQHQPNCIFHTYHMIDEQLERFAALVRADEREARAKLIESRKTGANELMDAVRDMEARAIRARGQA